MDTELLLDIWKNKNVNILMKDNFRHFGKCVNHDRLFIYIELHSPKQLKAINLSDICSIADDTKQNISEHAGGARY